MFLNLVMTGLILGPGAAAGDSPPDATAPDLRANGVLDPAVGAVEVLQSHAAWCGPRILYFFTCYYGCERPLDEVIRVSNTDPNGFTCLADLVRAAKEFGLDPLAVHCQGDELCDLGGPAIISVRVPATATRGPATGAAPPGSPSVHFIGLLRCVDNKCLVVDPATDVRPFWVARVKLGQRFTGHAVLLKGCPRPSALTEWLKPAGVALAAAVLLLGLSAWRPRLFASRASDGGTRR